MKKRLMKAVGLIVFLVLLAVIVGIRLHTQSDFYYQLTKDKVVEDEDLSVEMIGNSLNYKIRFTNGSGLYDKARLVRKGSNYLIYLSDSDFEAQKMLVSYSLSGHINNISPGKHTLKVYGKNSGEDTLLGDKEFYYEPGVVSLDFAYKIESGPKDSPKNQINKLTLIQYDNQVDFSLSFLSGGGNFEKAKLEQNGNNLNVIMYNISGNLLDMFVSYNLSGSIKNIPPGRYHLKIIGETTELDIIATKDFTIE